MNQLLGYATSLPGKVVASGLLIGGAMELFMLKTGFYEKELEREAHNRMVIENNRQDFLERLTPAERAELDQLLQSTLKRKVPGISDASTGEN
ncbi:hypothetical protein SARC_15039 [Sphaeroforma arctica JP610]|uniref:Uncharacterized protein n=1 Tax=Sphaeroforma arctica JP610 TaxID=667725 RepID=A0A0L0F6Z0_9EUKA|nr:hypothetical protein SARC_15039 [Sphaeroforma arctica JP610]KNC72404.1 hypothetical protein SARC_15039 [Sphaeroforma arctica JP610]|eukprot:XP_014146306.1 hypothetical protein SARC_15039 [Sphaeroforma arctica JP610]